MFSGGALERMSILALGIMPYISASIIMQLMTAVTPSLEQLKKEGDAGRRKISQYTPLFNDHCFGYYSRFAMCQWVLASQGMVYQRYPSFLFTFVAIVHW